MAKLANGQAKQIIVAINDAGYAIADAGGNASSIKVRDMEKAGRAAYEAVRPIVLAEALAEPSDSELIGSAIDALTNWSFEEGRDYDRVRRIFANRLARLTAPPLDPAVEVRP